MLWVYLLIRWWKGDVSLSPCSFRSAFMIAIAIIVVVVDTVFIDDVHFAIIYFFCSGVVLKTMTLFYIGC